MIDELALTLNNILIDVERVGDTTINSFTKKGLSGSLTGKFYLPNWNGDRVKQIYPCPDMIEVLKDYGMGRIVLCINEEVRKKARQWDALAIRLEKKGYISDELKGR